MKSMTALRSMVLLGLLSVLAGCQTDAPITARGEQYDYPWLMLGSKDLRVSTRVGDARRTRDEAGLLYVSVPVRNTTDKQLYIDCRVTFYDSNEMELSTVRSTLTIPARGLRDATANSTSPKAESFRMELTYPRVN